VTIAFAITSGEIERNSVAPLETFVPIAAELSFNTLCRRKMVSLRGRRYSTIYADWPFEMEARLQNKLRNGFAIRDCSALLTRCASAASKTGITFGEA